METDIIVVLISSGLTLVGTILAVWAGMRKNSQEFEKKVEIFQAVTDTKIDELTREVRTNNNVKERVPVLEEQVKIVNHRIDNLERKVG